MTSVNIAFTAKLKAVWTACTEQSALHMLNECIELCEAIADDHGFDDIRKFGKLLSRRADGIAAACVVRFGTNMLEGALIVKISFRIFQHHKGTLENAILRGI